MAAGDAGALRGLRRIFASQHGSMHNLRALWGRGSTSLTAHGQNSHCLAVQVGLRGAQRPQGGLAAARRHNCSSLASSVRPNDLSRIWATKLSVDSGPSAQGFQGRRSIQGLRVSKTLSVQLEGATSGQTSPGWI